MPETATREWLSPQDLADWLGVHVVTLREWRRTGTGPRCYVLAPQTIRYRHADVHEWLEQRADRPAGAHAG
jgi:predicted site-specific integrase-resolvase